LKIFNDGINRQKKLSRILLKKLDNPNFDNINIFGDDIWIEIIEIKENNIKSYKSYKLDNNELFDFLIEEEKKLLKKIKKIKVIDQKNIELANINDDYWNR
jgi:hypothetical protein